MSQESAFHSRRSGSPFSARGFTPKVEIDSRSNGSNKQEDTSKPQRFTNISSELTRNSNYVVSKLSATPLQLKTASASDFTGSIDEKTGHGLLVSSEAIYTWAYNSVDGIPVTIQLPITPSNNGFPVLTLLVSPSAGSTEPGLVVVNSHTGHLRFYENIDNASSIGLLQRHKGIDHLLRLYDREIITIAESIEPAGILLATNQGRLILMSLRDSTGKPSIKTFDIIRRQVGFFSSTLDLSRQIISIKPGASLGQGERVAAVVTSGGDFQVWLFSSDGQSRSIFHSNLFNLLVSSINGLFPSAVRTFEILDFALLTNFENEDVFLLLTSFENGPGETIYNLFTVKKEGNELHVFSAYKINTFTKISETKPTLYVPSPKTTAFIVFENAIVLTELITKLDHDLNMKRKWEDIITFRDGIKIIGSGAQDLLNVNDVTVQFPSVLAVVPNVGVLRVDRLKPKESETNEVGVTTFLKSHIEQAVFYGEDQQNPIEFDITEDLNIETPEIENDLLEAAEEILLSTSQYLPPRLLTTEAHLELRQQKLEKLLDYAAHNFKDRISDKVKLTIISVVEKITAAHQLQKIISKYSSDPEVTSLFEKSFKNFSRGSKSSDFLYNGLHQLNDYLTRLLHQLNSAAGRENLGAEVVTSVYSAVLEIEKKYRFEIFGLDASQSGFSPFWFTSNEVYFVIDEIFRKFSNLHRSSPKDTSLTNQVINLSEILFYQSQQALVWLKNQTPKTREIQDSITRVQGFYEAKSGVWTKTLVIFDAKAEALAIAETYQDLKSLVEISEADRESVEGEELEQVYMRFDYYFNKFKYQFAETLYKYYIYTGNYKDLLLEFQQYSEYLTNFFNENNYGKISWIKDIFDSDYAKAAKVLLEVSQKNDESLRDRNVQLSIAKLSALASLENDQVNQDTEELLSDIQEELNFIDAQGTIFEQIHDFIRSDSDPTAQIDSVVKDLLQGLYSTGPYKLIKKSFERSLARLLSNKSLVVNELVDIFTLLDSSKTQNNLNYYYALKVLHLSTLSESEKHINEKLIWKRAILSDRWKDIINSVNKSDSFIQESIQGTVVFETLLHYFKDGLFANNNDYSISLPDTKKLIEEDGTQELLHRFQFITQGELPKFRAELKGENDALLELYSYGEFDQWIKALVGTANEQSGANKVINYNTMSIES